MSGDTLVQQFEDAFRRWPSRVAVVDPSGETLTYAALNEQANRVATYLRRQGVGRGDRVGVVLRKSAASLSILLGAMKAGAGYVPADYSAPAERNLKILSDGAVRVAFLDHTCQDVAEQGRDTFPSVIIAQGSEGPPAGAASWADVMATRPDGVEIALAPGDLAYILYTSGSTGVPKGVVLTHENAVSFVDWCSSVFSPTEEDRFSSHAPFHFDLSVLDLYLCLKHGGTLFLISEALGKTPRELAQFIADNRLTVWYSTPSILALLAQFGHLDSLDCTSLRLVLFAGEVFPVKHLRAIKTAWPWPIYYNLYGPTETNVCTFARIPDVVPEDREHPYPIGFACSHCEPLVLDEEREVGAGEEGLLYIAGPSVFQGYRNRPAENALAFLERNGKRWYNTGDVVREAPDEGFIYVGRRDRMVKRRGFRVELGEIEAGLYRHHLIGEAAVLAVPDEASGVRVIAAVSAKTEQRPSIIELKGFCAKHLPASMIPDAFVFLDKLPRTSTDKVDYQTLKRLVQAP